MPRFVLLVAACAAPLSPLCAQSFTETFSGGTNAGGWNWGVGNPDAIEPAGGNPGEFLHQEKADVAVPEVRTQGTSAFTGDWRARGVNRFDFDLLTISTQFPALREATLKLTRLNGPGFMDDQPIYFIGPDTVPQPGQGWKSFSYSIPVSSPTMPAGWIARDPNTGLPPADPDQWWNDVITNVDQVSVFYGHPDFFYIFDIWNVGIDNPSIVEGGGAQNYCTGKVNSAGCTATMTSSGTPSETSASPFTLGANNVLNQKNGLVFWGLASATLPFQGGTLCVQPPLKREAIQNSGGTVGPPDCSGTFSMDFNTVIQSTSLLDPGDAGFVQTWYRDPADAFGIGLTDAVTFTVQP